MGSSLIALSASLGSNLALYPFDLLRVRLQVEAVKPGSASWSPRVLARHVRGIWGAHGPRGFYAGLSGGLLGPAAAWGSWYGAYTFFKSAEYARLCERLPDLGLPPALRNFGAGIQAGLVMSVVTNPIFVTKTRMQTAAAFPPPSLALAASQIYRADGLRGFYRGFLLAVPLTTHAALHWAIYEQFKEAILGRNPSRGLTKTETLAVASSSKVVAAVSTFPLQLMRTCLMAEHGATSWGRIPQLTTGIWRANGIMGFYSGFLAHLLRTVPNSTLTMFIIEHLTQFVEASSNNH
ncbi:MAG: MC/SLC25 family protein [archaeon]|nr:MC/SLC25 family protein [archaeon]